MHRNAFLTVIFCLSSKHTVVCHVAQKNRTHANYRNKKVTNITHSPFCDLLSTLCQIFCKGVRLLRKTARQILIELSQPFPIYSTVLVSKLKCVFFFIFFFLSFFCTLGKIALPHKLVLQSCWNWYTCTASWVIIITNFGENSYKIPRSRVIIDHLPKTKTIFNHTYRVNCSLNQPENCFVARPSIRGMPFSC